MKNRNVLHVGYHGANLDMICFVHVFLWAWVAVIFYCLILGCVLVSQALRENTYPFLAMIMLKDRKMTVVGRLEGLIQPEDLINQLTFIMDANQTYLMSERLERYEKSVKSK